MKIWHTVWPYVCQLGRCIFSVLSFLYTLARGARKHIRTVSILLRRQCRGHPRAPRGVTIVASAGVSEVLSQIADGVLAVPPTAYGALGAIGLLGAALFVADPEKR